VEELYSVDQVADLLGLHVKTVRGYVRDGRLKAVRIGKQYRIRRADLAAFTGRSVAGPARETAVRHRRVEVSTVVRIDAIDQATMSRLATYLTGSVDQDRPGNPHVQAIYDEERAALQVVIIGDLTHTADLLKLTELLLEQSHD
jgi:excisionase family DNA binding protein